MCQLRFKSILEILTIVGGLLGGSLLRANGGPFVVKYPSGDPAAKGVLARLDPSLLPARETRLRVLKEDLKINFGVKAEFPTPKAVSANSLLDAP